MATNVEDTRIYNSSGGNLGGVITGASTGASEHFQAVQQVTGFSVGINLPGLNAGTGLNLVAGPSFHQVHYVEGGGNPTLQLQQDGEATGGRVIPLLTAGAGLERVNLPGETESGWLVLSYEPTNLPGADETGQFTVSRRKPWLFNDLTGSEVTSGAVHHRCIYVYNDNSTETAQNVSITINSQPIADDTLDIGLDPAGKGDGTTTGVATTIASETDIPAGVTFGTSDLAIGTLAPGEGHAFWVRRTIVAGSHPAVFDDISALSIKVFT